MRLKEVVIYYYELVMVVFVVNFLLFNVLKGNFFLFNLRFKYFVYVFMKVIGVMKNEVWFFIKEFCMIGYLFLYFLRVDVVVNWWIIVNIVIRERFCIEDVWIVFFFYFCKYYDFFWLFVLVIIVGI